MSGTTGRGRPARAFLLAALAAAAAWGCGGKPPEVSAVEWRLELRPSPAGSYESLSAFASIKDDEGIDDIESVYVVQDEALLDWKLTNANWVKRSEGADTWLGGSCLARGDFGPLPRGAYRFVAVNAAGDRAERRFDVDGDFPQIAAPTATVAKRSIEVRSAWPETLALGFDGAGALVGTAVAPTAPVGIDELFGSDPASRITEVCAYGYDPARRMGAYSERAATR